MKNVKLILPALAIVFALIATTTSNSRPLINEQVVIDGSAQCTYVGNCTNPADINAPLCKNGSNQQLDVRASSLSCTVPARGTFTPKP